MPISSTGSSQAAAAAESELERWELLIDGAWSITEREVVVYFDPAPDLERRARAWKYELPAFGLSDLAVLGAALAQAEADAWYHDEGHIATRALEDRRFLLGDRLLHWAVPWLAEQGTDSALEAMATLLMLGEEHRPSPLLSGIEGIFAPGEDSYGPVGRRPLDSIWCGAWIPKGADPLQHLAVARERWNHFVAAYPGSARLWNDLAARAGQAPT